MKTLVASYVFAPSAGTITFSDYASIDLNRIVSVLNATTGTMLYDPGFCFKGGSVTNNVLSLRCACGGMSASDTLLIWYEAGYAAPSQIIKTVPGVVANTIVVTNGGSGYTGPFAVTFTGGGGTGAAATATVGGGVVLSVAVTNGGSGYTSAPTPVFTAGGGTNAAATVLLGPGIPVRISATRAAYFTTALVLGRNAARSVNTGNAYIGVTSAAASQPLLVAPDDERLIQIRSGGRGDLYDWYVETAVANEGLIVIYS